MEDRKEKVNEKEKSMKVSSYKISRRGWLENGEKSWKNTRHDGVKDKEDKAELIENDGLIKHKK